MTVEPIVAGRVTWSRSMMETPEGRFLTLKLLRALISGEPAMTVPCPAFLIRHPSAGAILVDTGLHPSIATDGRENFGGLGARFGNPSLEPGEDVPAQLRKRGLDPGEVPIVVMTHLHIDHSSAISEFPQSTFVVSEVEWEAATVGPKPLLNGYRRAHYDYAFDYRTVDFGRGSVDSYASFGRTWDLFGDGSIRLAYTPGHSAGHMSVIARLEQRDFVIGGDATYTSGQLAGTAPLGAAALRRPQLPALAAGAEAVQPRVPGRDRHPRARPGVLRAARGALRVDGAARLVASPSAAGRRRRPRSGRRVLALDVEFRKDPVQPLRHVPDPVAEQQHQGRQEDDADDGRVEQDGDRQADAELADGRDRRRGEGDEDGHHDRRRAGDHPRGLLEARREIAAALSPSRS